MNNLLKLRHTKRLIASPIVLAQMTKMPLQQPVYLLAEELGQITGVPVFDNIVVQSLAPERSPKLKDLPNREAKDAALAGRFSINSSIQNNGCWNGLLLDDLFDTGATTNAICNALRTYDKINHIYAASITWKGGADNNLDYFKKVEHVFI